MFFGVEVQLAAERFWIVYVAVVASDVEVADEHDLGVAARCQRTP